ncbi:MAG: Phosphopantothenoylcysteine decarboxylase / Phosphopantothenoylcysteine synthetase, partial [uncultured Lysobacter sp.]
VRVARPASSALRLRWHRRLQGLRARAAAARCRRERARGDDRERAALRWRPDVPGTERRAGAHVAMGRTGRGGDGAYRTRPLAASHPHCTGNGEHDREARTRLRRRPCHDAVPGHARTDRNRPGDEPGHVVPSGDAGEHRDATRARRRDPWARHRRTGLWRDRRRPAAGAAGPHRSTQREAGM